MQCQGIAVVETEQVGIVEIELGILRIGDVQEGALSMGIGLEPQCPGEAIQQISCRFYVESEGIHPVAIR